MTHTRRATIAGAATLLLSGCLGFVTGSSPAEFEASPARPTEEALSNTGYEEQEFTSETLEETVEVLGQEREVHATVHVGTYTKSVTFMGQTTEAAAFAVVSVPDVEVLGHSFNPLGEMDSKELLEEIQRNAGDDVEGLRNIEHVDERQQTILGESVTVDVLEGTMSTGGQEVELRIHLTTVAHDGDLVVLFGMHPRHLPDEGFNIEELMGSVEHGE